MAVPPSTHHVKWLCEVFYLLEPLLILLLSAGLGFPGSSGTAFSSVVTASAPKKPLLINDHKHAAFVSTSYVHLNMSHFHKDEDEDYDDDNDDVLDKFTETVRKNWPNVCEEQKLTVVGILQPCVQAFTHMVKLWKQGCTHLDGVRVMKEDVNECTMDNGGCRAQCCNTTGSYYCRCQAGQKLEEDGRGCEDVDECTVVSGGCQQRCINTLGTFHCECDTGYRLHADERTCIKMDPCTGGNGCAHICQNENGMPRCACHPGYQLSEDKKACEDINERTEGLAHCGHRCVNSVGSFTRVCHPAFELGANGKQCYRIELEIVNSCEKNNGRCSHHCERASGGPPCSCNHGHQPDSEEKTCIDLDECENGEACCAQLCINYLGEYECSCQEGFVISSDGCGCDALDDGELEGQKVLEVANFPGFLIQSPPRFLHYVATSLTPSYEDEEEEEEKDLQGLIVLPKVGGLRGSFGKNCKSKCNCANNGHCHRMYGTCVCEPGRCGKFCHLRCPKGVYGAGCSSECQCVEENTLECSAKNGSCTCKYGYQGNRCQKGTYEKDCDQVCQWAAKNEDGHTDTHLSAWLPWKPLSSPQMCRLNTIGNTRVIMGMLSQSYDPRRQHRVCCCSP
ncbi:EGF-like and EMI domain-containing protein 1 [Fukomys damarensis]|uniref:EGF-like and EMI domain-containing protein 1 n=1 Tax=Fukomys damarensis TaxID=885580 RepID=UPI001455575A|nr:EGF-like and EMI domain-containing protein 1 [Fukomys damarensis]